MELPLLYLLVLDGWLSNDHCNKLTYLDSDPMLKFKWDVATQLDITHPLVISASQSLGFNAQEIFNSTRGNP